MARYFTVVTDYGVAEMMKSVKEETKVNITKFAVGDGNGNECTPSTGQTRLVKEVWRGVVGNCYISEDSENLLIVESVIPSDIGGFTIREMGLFDDKGGLIAVCNTPNTQKVRVSDGVVHELNLSMEIALTNTESVQLVIDPNVITVTKRELEKVRTDVEAEISAVQRVILQMLVNGEAHVPLSTEDGKILTAENMDVLEASFRHSGGGDIQRKGGAGLDENR